MQKPGEAVGTGTRVIAGLDGVRGLALLLVVAFHLDGGRVPAGALGVDMFFVLSGYLITGLLLSEHRRTGRVDLVLFYRNRLLRLYPALIVFLIITLPAGRILGESWSLLAERTWQGALYLQDFVFAGWFGPHREPDVHGHLWSLAVEEQFYLLWPLLLILLFRLFTPEIRVWVMSELLTGAVALRWAAGDVLGDGQVYFTPLGHLDGLFAGALAAQLGRSAYQPVIRRLCDNNGVALVCLVLVPLAAVLLQPPHQRWLNNGLGLLLDLAVAGLLLHVAGRDRLSGLPRLLTTSWLRWVGRRSYGLYLYHLIPVRIVDHYTGSRLLVTAIGIPVSVLMAEVSWRFMEAPFLRRKRHAVPALMPDATGSRA